MGTRLSRSIALPDALVVFGATACLFDALTTWVALHRSGLREESPAVSALIHGLGLVSGLAVSLVLRVAVFAFVAVVMDRLPRLSLPLFAIGLVGAAATWLLVLNNIAALVAR